MKTSEGIFMEQKKTLWIVAATGIFLLVVVGAALILYSPSLNQSSGAKSGLQAGFDPTTGWISSTKQGATPVPESSLSFNTETSAPNETAALTPSPFTSIDNNSESQKTAQNSDNALHADKLTVIADNTTVYSNETTTIDLNSLKATPNNGNGIIAKNEMTANQINTNRQTEPKTSYEEPVAENYYTPAPVTKAAPEKQAPKSTATATAKATPKSTAKASSSTAVAKAPAPKASTAKKVAAAAKKTPDSFWVQAAAYTSKRNADEARTTLESNKIPSEVFTFTDSNGKTFYRVRVGPYITKSEAEYWQTRIAMIDKFASAKSVIVNTSIN